MIRYGFRTHATGKWVKRAGVGVAGLGLGALGLHEGARYLANAGLYRSPYHFGQGARRLYELSGIGRRVPAVGYAAERVGGAVADWGRRAARRAAAWVAAHPKRIARARMVARFGDRVRLGSRGLTAGKIGVVVGLGGLAVERIGSGMIRAGFLSHPGGIRKRVWRFFGFRT
jgi:hypothetical protein